MTATPTTGGFATGDESVLVVDFGAQYAQLIARRVREARVYSEIVPPTITAAEVAARKPVGIILSGGPKSVHVEGAPRLDPEIYQLGVPILGICYGAQLVAQQLGGRVDRTGRGEYGRCELTLAGGGGVLGSGLPASQTVWMSHFDGIADPPPGFAVTARTPDCPVAALEDPARHIYAVQFHPEVGHTEQGQRYLERFLVHGCGAAQSWTMTSVIDESVAAIAAQVGPEGRAICGLSGGVDSAVAAALVHRAIGHRLTCVFVDTGLMRAGEGDQVAETFRRHQGMELVHVRAGDRFFERLAGLTDPEEKRKAVGELFIRVFEEARGGVTDAQFLVQGTLYPDVIESGTSTAAKIKSHHNVGGLPDDLDFDLVEPLRSLFKDEVRKVGSELGLPGRDRLAAALSRPGSERAHHRRGHSREGGVVAAGRPDRARGDPQRRTGTRDLAGLRRATRHPLRWRAWATNAPTGTRSSSVPSPATTP